MEKGVLGRENSMCQGACVQPARPESGVQNGPQGQSRDVTWMQRGHRGQGGKGPEGQPEELGLDPVTGRDCEVLQCRGLKGATQIFLVTEPWLKPAAPLAHTGSRGLRRKSI